MFSLYILYNLYILKLIILCILSAEMGRNNGKNLVSLQLIGTSGSVQSAIDALHDRFKDLENRTSVQFSAMLSDADYTALRMLYKEEIGFLKLSYNRENCEIRCLGKSCEKEKVINRLGVIIKEVEEMERYCLSESLPPQAQKELNGFRNVCCVVDRYKGLATIYGRTEADWENIKRVLHRFNLTNIEFPKLHRSEVPNLLDCQSSFCSQMNHSNGGDGQGSLSQPAHLKNQQPYQVKNLDVYVYVGNIVDLPVDCIVNATNPDLQHCRGVPGVILKADGPTVREEPWHIIKNKSIFISIFL